ncbi:MAG: gluconate 2-dehydrogenase subunit 3 family protein [Steroidobacteraceae bacterium]
MAGGTSVIAGLLLDGAWLSQAHAAGARYQSDPRHAFADRISDLLIPTTDTPGASAAGVAGFVLLALDSGVSGLKPALLDAVQAELDASAGGKFVGRPRNRQAGLLAELDRKAFAAASPAENSAEFAWRRIKSAIVAGYYTSEIGGSKELIYEPVPGKFENIALTAEYRARSNDGQGGAI